MSWFWMVMLAAFIGSNFSDCSRHHLKHSVVIVGSVSCDTCFLPNFHKSRHFITDASVAVGCEGAASSLSFRQQVKTDSHGEFRVHLPPSIGKHVSRIKNCSVDLISSNEPHCAIAATSESSSLRLESKARGSRIFSIGLFTLKPLKQPNWCDQKPGIDQSKENHNTENSSVEDQPDAFASSPSNPLLLGGLLPPLPRLPSLPPLPRLPPLPEIPPLPQLPHLPPIANIPFLRPPPSKEPATEASQVGESKVDQSQGFPFPPIPFFPNFPPLFSTPSAPPVFQLPTIPGLTPALPTTPQPTTPQPTLPTFPFQPIPGFPGIPPAQVSYKPKTKAP